MCVCVVVMCVWVCVCVLQCDQTNRQQQGGQAQGGERTAGSGLTECEGKQPLGLSSFLFPSVWWWWWWWLCLSAPFCACLFARPSDTASFICVNLSPLVSFFLSVCLSVCPSISLSHRPHPPPPSLHLSVLRNHFHPLSFPPLLTATSLIHICNYRGNNCQPSHPHPHPEVSQPVSGRSVYPNRLCAGPFPGTRVCPASQQRPGLQEGRPVPGQPTD